MLLTRARYFLLPHFNQFDSITHFDFINIFLPKKTQNPSINLTQIAHTHTHIQIQKGSSVYSNIYSKQHIYFSKCVDSISVDKQQQPSHTVWYLARRYDFTSLIARSFPPAKHTLGWFWECRGRDWLQWKSGARFKQNARVRLLCDENGSGRQSPSKQQQRARANVSSIKIIYCESRTPYHEHHSVWEIADVLSVDWVHSFYKHLFYNFG